MSQIKCETCKRIFLGQTDKEDTCPECLIWGAKMKHYQYDKCPQCKEGTLETVEMKGEEYLACDECDFTHFEGD